MNMRRMWKTCSVAISLALGACIPPAPHGDDAEGDGGDESSDESGAEGGEGNGVETEDEGDGVYVSVVDARDEASWVRFDFESRRVVGEDSAAWDLGFQRFNIETRVEVAVLEGQDFAGLKKAPADGYITDGEMVDPESMETMPGYAFDLWYAYNPMTHVLTAVEDRVYVVHTPEGGYFKVQMLEYYDDAGTSGYVTLRWAAVEAP